MCVYRSILSESLHLNHGLRIFIIQMYAYNGLYIASII